MHPDTLKIRQKLSGKIVVALDTNVLSALESEQKPSWFSDFIEMSKNEIFFSIPDLCIGEHINSYEYIEERCCNLLAEKWKRMIARIDQIIWKELPCLPLRGDLYDLVGFVEKNAMFSRNNVFTIETSQRLYRHFYGYANSTYNATEWRQSFIDEVSRERAKWRDLIQCIRKKLETIPKEELFEYILAKHNAEFSCNADLRQILALPVRFAIEHASDSQYDPSPCKKGKDKKNFNNDGLDYLILHLTMASINICSSDHFFRDARKLNLLRVNCCYSSDSLVANWRSGELPKVSLGENQ